MLPVVFLLALTGCAGESDTVPVVLDEVIDRGTYEISDQSGTDIISDSVIELPADPVSPAPQPQSVTVSWEDPTRNTDDSCINQLQGYILHYGTSSGSYSNSVDTQLSQGDISCTQTAYDNACGAPAMTCSFVTDVLPPDTWYFAIQAYDQPGNVSGLSNEIVRVIN